MEKGVKGFRFDVINLISKAGFEDDFSVDGDEAFIQMDHVFMNFYKN